MASVEFQNVSKIYSRRMSRQLLRSWLAKRFKPAPHHDFYALRDVSFRLEHGDSLAVVGPNGAGKTTLLSLVAGLSWPDQGKVVADGRIAALLELGSGFHPDLTGAENVYLNAALLGLGKRRARERFDAIVAFSGMAEFIDEPLRTYSAGMIMRLAFSVAMNVDPEVLLIDEVLAVGDQAFQAKCFDKVMDLKRAGSILICVSHVAETLRQLCTRAIWLDGGRVVREGAAREVIDAYQAAAGGRP